MFQYFPDKKFSIDSICNELVIPKIDSEKIREYLTSYENSNVIFSLDGEWTSSINMDKKIRNYVHRQIRENVLQILNEKKDTSKSDSVKDRYSTGETHHHVNEKTVIDKIENIFSNDDLFKLIEKGKIDSRQEIQDEIRMMVSDGLIIEFDKMLSKKD